jgi:cobalt-zinc-cadmium efflux system membrane fusion protein
MTWRPSKRVVLIAGCGALLLVAGVGWGLRKPPLGTAAAAIVSVDETRDAGQRQLALPGGARVSNPVATAPVALVKLAGDIQLVGAVSFDQDHLALVGPLVGGRVARLAVGVGDRVRRGQVLGEIESAEVGQARAEFIAARARTSATEINLRRETDLAERRISSARERELAEAQWITEHAGLRAATERLRAMGLTAADIATVERKDQGGLIPMRAPIDGVVLRRSVTLGQAVERATDAFQIADTEHVWVNLDLYEKDLPRVHAGQRVEIRADAYPSEVFKGRVAYVVPEVDQATRTAKVRIALPNPGGKLSFGQLITARLVGDPSRMATPVLAIPRAAIQRVEGRTVVFVQTTAGFQRRFVELGFSTGDEVEIRRGVEAGERVVADGAFLLKSELLR